MGKKNDRSPTADNLAKAFTPRQPICGPDYDANRMVVLMDVPVKLFVQKTFDDGVDVIDKQCLRQNVEILFHLFESICCQHVLSQQADPQTDPA